MSQQNTNASGDRGPAPLSRSGLIIVTLCSVAATLMQALDGTIANVALPYMQGSMAASQDEINWVLTSYIIATAIMTAPVGFLAARFGRTRLFLTSIIGFSIASVLCGTAQSLVEIVGFRILQGMFSAALVPLSQSVMYEIYPPEKRGQAMALWGMGVTIGPVLGPIIGGWLTEDYSWRWVFYINVPVGILAAAGILIYLKETPRNLAAKLDWMGFAALSIALGAFQLMLDRGEELDWFSSPEIIFEACVAGVGFYCFLVHSALVPKPFLNPKIFTDRNFVVASCFMFVVGVIIYASMALLAPYLQTLLNYPAITAGNLLGPRGFGSMFAMLVAGRLIPRTGSRPLVTVGLITCAYSLYEMSHWTPDISQWTILSVGMIQGVGVGLIFVPLSTIVFSTLPLELRTEATGVYSLMRNLGSAIGISVTASLLQTNAEINHALISGVVTPFNRALQSGAVARFWGPLSVHGANALDAEVQRQAAIIAYIDDYKLMLVMCVLVLPLVLLIRSPGVVVKARAPQQAAAAAAGE
jgi:DHA2 family multidrug resistance protein